MSNNRIFNGDYNYNVKKSLIGHWPLNSTDGATDLINGNNGTLNGGMTYGSSGGREYAVFDGVDDYVDIGKVSTFDFAGSFSLAAWVNGLGASNTIISKSDNSGAGAGYFFYTGAATQLIFSVWSGGSGVDAFHTISATGWQHVCAVFRSATDAVLYVNGVAGTAVGTAVVAPASSAYSLQIGRHQRAGLPYLASGDMYDFRLYNRALSGAEIARLARIY